MNIRKLSEEITSVIYAPRWFSLLLLIALLILLYNILSGKLFSGLKFLFAQFLSIYASNPIGTISITASFIGIMLLYYGALLASENKYTSLTERIWIYLEGLRYFTGILSISLIVYLIYLRDLFSVLIAILLIHQFLCFSDIVSKLQGRYNYDNLINRLKRNFVYENKTWLLHLLLVFIIALDVFSLKILGIKIVIVAWLIFVSTTEIALLASLQEARYFLVDIDLQNGDKYRKAILIREEGKDFIRIIPKPSDENKIYEGILLNRHQISSINFINSYSLKNKK